MFTKYLRYSLITLCLLLITGMIAARYLVNHYENKLLDYQTDKFHLTAKGAEITLINGAVNLDHPQLHLLTQTDSIVITASAIALSGLSYTDILLQRAITLKRIQLDQAQLSKQPRSSSSIPVTDTLSTTPEWSVHHINLNQFQYTALDKKGDTLLAIKEMECHGLELEMKKKQLYLGYQKEFVLRTGQFTHVQNGGGTIAYDSLQVHPEFLNIRALSIHPGFTKTEYSKHIPSQKDWIAVSVDSLVINYQSPPTLPLRSLAFTKVETFGVHLQAYRDKFVPRKEVYKPLYSKMLRDIPLELKIDTLKLHNSDIVYEELVNKNQQAGSLTLKPVNATFYAIQNINTTKTTFELSAGMMESAVLYLRGGFAVKDTLDRFHIQAQIEAIPVEKFKSFTVPNMQLTATGRIDRLNYTISGNDHHAMANLQLQYTDLHVRMLQKNGTADKKLISALANILVKRDKYMPEPIHYKVDRNQNRSLINFIWSCLAEGLKQTLI